MTPALATTIIFGLEQLLKEAPAMYASIAALFQKTDVTVEDLQALRAQIAGETYEGFVPDSKLPKP